MTSISKTSISKTSISKTSISKRWASLVLCAVASLVVAGCDDTPTTAVVENGFAASASATMTVYKAWWTTTLFPSPVAAGATSETERTIPGTDYAYALLAPGWTFAAGGRPPRLVAVRSSAKLSVAAHDVLHVVVTDDAFVGDCAAGPPLSADEAQLVTERIFPGEFSGATYAPATCTTTAASLDGGTTDAPPAAGATDAAPHASDGG